MQSIARAPFRAVFLAEILINLRRVAPYAMMALFSGNALLWWGAGPATYRGWSTNSEHFILSMMSVFSFMTCPLFTAVIMGEPVIRDFKVGIDPLIFSKPVSRAEYLLGKFFGNFFVVVCCQACFALTLFGLQGVSVSGMIVGPVQVAPYFKHFFFIVVLSHLFLAILYFTVGSLTRNVRIVYGLALSFYPVYITWQVAVLKKMPGWRVILDPMAFNWGDAITHGHDAEWLNQATLSYTADVIANRGLVVLLSAACFAFLYARFSRVERSRDREARGRTSIFNLTPQSERLYEEVGMAGLVETTEFWQAPAASAPLPIVRTVGTGLRENFARFLAALGVELRLLRAELSLIVVLPIAIFMCGLEVAYFGGGTGQSYSAAYASVTAEVSLLFLLGIGVFYTGESMHRDRELRIEPLLWSAPARNSILLLSKFAAVFMILFSLITLLTLISMAAQFYKGHGPVELLPYLTIHSVISVPNIIFMVGASVFLNVLLRDKYLTYAVSIATGVALYYLFTQGHNNWLYNFVLFRQWAYSDLTGEGSHQARILVQRVYCLALTALCLGLAHLLFERRSSRGVLGEGLSSGRGLAALAAIASAAIAVLTALILARAS
ncbi:MAG TPA: hypothetical protein VNH22_13805 [Blastocatellia bacterium]|jgi:ABC-type transport system involved in multi-copper enzyme maturation permease subunit|nr:hypothetical protein [Blastocatellia bacterium]